MFFVEKRKVILLILIFIRHFICAELVMLLANEKTFRDRGSGFK